MANGTNRGGERRHEPKGIKSTICTICGEEVTNRKSIAVPGNGRICKSHTRAVALVRAQMRSNNVSITVENLKAVA